MQTEKVREDIGQILREYLWLSHGHQGLYGDDGEMQCGECPADYKRDDLSELILKAKKAKEETAIKALATAHLSTTELPEKKELLSTDFDREDYPFPYGAKKQGFNKCLDQVAPPPRRQEC